MASRKTKLGHGLAKGLGIKLDYRSQAAPVTRGESVFSVSSADTYVEEEPTAVDWVRDSMPGTRDILRYARNLFPFTHWIGRYNLTWLAGDLVAGITIGAVVVPQGMAYAQLAELPVQFGLYSSFMGVLIYWLFATSKDITIGPVAVMSTITGTIVLNAQHTLPNVPGHVIASALSVIAGSIVCFLGLVRLGWIVEFIPLTSISAFMTGAALNIAVGQVPNLMGIPNVNNRASTYLVVIDSLKNLGHTKLDAAIGLTALFTLYLIRYSLTTLAKKFPRRAKLFFFLSTLRSVFIILLYTLISWLVNRHHRATNQHRFKILGTVPRGFQDAAVPTINTSIIRAFASQLPASVIVLLIEHISIAKSFGRVNNYTIDPSQELVAIGITNILGPFLGAYPATGSFSRTAIQSKAGVRTPFAGLITAIVVLLAIYALTAVFFYIPNAALSAVIIHAVGDLITPPNTVYQFWRISPLEIFIFFAGVLVTVFSSIENGIYTTICTSIALLLFRVAKARGRFLGKIKVHSVVGDHLFQDEEDKAHGKGQGRTLNAADPDQAARNVFLPIEHDDGSNPMIEVEKPYPGIFIYRFSEGYNYPNANHYLDYMVHTIFKETRRTNPSSYGKLGGRPWNDPGPRRGREWEIDESLPTLKAIVLDFSSVNNIDVTSVQHLIDVRNQLDRYASPDTVEWHLACINNRWTKRALASAGFGYPTLPSESGDFHRWKPIFSVAELGGQDSAANAAEWRDNEEELKRQYSRDAETGRSRSRGFGDINVASQSSLSRSLTESKAYGKERSGRVAYAHKIAVVHGVNRPLFHIDVTSALQSAIAHVESRESAEADGLGTGNGPEATPSPEGSLSPEKVGAAAA